jgi:hypothetical protein
LDYAIGNCGHCAAPTWGRKALRELGTTVGVLLTGQIERARVQDEHTEKLDRLATSVDAIVRRLGITDSQSREG